LGLLVASMVGPRYGKPACGLSDQYPQVLVAGRLGWNFHVVDPLAAITKLLPPPLASSTGGTGKAAAHFLSLGVAPIAGRAAIANDERPTTRPAPPIAPRSRSCRLVSMIPPILPGVRIRTVPTLPGTRLLRVAPSHQVSGRLSPRRLRPHIRSRPQRRCGYIRVSWLPDQALESVETWNDGFGRQVTFPNAGPSECRLTACREERPRCDAFGWASRS